MEKLQQQTENSQLKNSSGNHIAFARIEIIKNYIFVQNVAI